MKHCFNTFIDSNSHSHPCIYNDISNCHKIITFVFSQRLELKKSLLLFWGEGDGYESHPSHCLARDINTPVIVLSFTIVYLIFQTCILPWAHSRPVTSHKKFSWVVPSLFFIKITISVQPNNKNESWKWNHSCPNTILSLLTFDTQINDCRSVLPCGIYFTSQS
jgi:hypothetical protein